MWRIFLRRRLAGVDRARCQRRAKHRLHSLEPSGNTLTQEQGETHAPRLVCNSSISLSRVPGRADDLVAKQLVLNGVLRGVELCGFDDHRRFFSACI
jgi:hypothetical protein